MKQHSSIVVSLRAKGKCEKHSSQLQIPSSLEEPSENQAEQEIVRPEQLEGDDYESIFPAIAPLQVH
jgi:hypothetical protein